MASVNRVVLIGRLTRDPELRKTSSDLSVVSFTIAVDGRTQRDGENNASFFSCVAWKGTAENVKKFTHKGSLVAIDGHLQQRSYMSKDNRKMSVVEVVCDSVQFLDPKNSSAAHQEPDDVNDFSADSKSDSFVEGLDNSDDDLPF